VSPGWLTKCNILNVESAKLDPVAINLTV